MTKKYFVYFHRRPDTGEVFYVGRGKSSQASAPVRRAYVKQERSKPWRSIVERNGGKYSVEIVEWFDTHEEAGLREIYHIKAIGRKRDGGPLINLSDGGDGVDGYKHTDEAREKLRAAWARNPARKDHLKSESFQEARKKAVVGRPSAMLGKRHSAETLALYSEQRVGAKNSQAKVVIDAATGIEYGCVGEAAAAIGLARSTVHDYLAPNCGRKNTTTLRYK